jgi:hypothetical protein
MDYSESFLQDGAGKDDKIINEEIQKLRNLVNTYNKILTDSRYKIFFSDKDYAQNFLVKALKNDGKDTAKYDKPYSAYVINQSSSSSSSSSNTKTKTIGAQKKSTLDALANSKKMTDYIETMQLTGQLQTILLLTKELIDIIDKLCSLQLSKSNKKDISDILLNVGFQLPCNLDQKKAKEKYLKYKMKYLELKRQIEENSI